jgi:hypothetical protein
MVVRSDEELSSIELHFIDTALYNGDLEMQSSILEVKPLPGNHTSEFINTKLMASIHSLNGSEAPLFCCENMLLMVYCGEALTAKRVSMIGDALMNQVISLSNLKRVVNLSMEDLNMKREPHCIRIINLFVSLVYCCDAMIPIGVDTQVQTNEFFPLFIPSYYFFFTFKLRDVETTAGFWRCFSAICV